MYFTKLNSNGSGTPAPHTHTEFFIARTPDEGANQTGSNTQVADPFILEWPYAQGDSRNSSYLYYTACAFSCAALSSIEMSIKVAVIPSPMKSILASTNTQSDALLTAGTAWPLASGAQFDDASGTGAMGLNWSSVGGNAQIAVRASGVFEPNNTSTAGREVFIGASFPRNQYSSIVLRAGAATTSEGPNVRGSLSTSNTLYECLTVAALGTSQTMLLRKIVAGTVTNLTTFTATPAVGDVWELDAVGDLLTCKQNGVVKATGVDSAIPNGLPGFTIFDSSAVTNAQLSNWIGGPL